MQDDDSAYQQKCCQKGTKPRYERANGSVRRIHDAFPRPLAILQSYINTLLTFLMMSSTNDTSTTIYIYIMERRNLGSLVRNSSTDLGFLAPVTHPSRQYRHTRQHCTPVASERRESPPLPSVWFLYTSRDARRVPLDGGGRAAKVLSNSRASRYSFIVSRTSFANFHRSFCLESQSSSATFFLSRHSSSHIALSSCRQ